jgi:hypothetical protein
MSAQPSYPKGGITLVGPFWTRREVARHLGVRPGEVAGWGLLRITGRLAVEEVYPTFQFAEVGLRRDLALVAVLLARRMDHPAACDWLFRPNPGLRDVAPIQWLADRGSFESVLRVLPPDGRRRTPDRSDIDEARAAWLEASRTGATRVGLTAPWNGRAPCGVAAPIGPGAT